VSIQLFGVLVATVGLSIIISAILFSAVALGSEIV
jgi:hypothetical protein